MSRSRGPVRALALLVPLVGGLLLAGCADGAVDDGPAPTDDGAPAAGTQVGPPDPDDIDPGRLEPLLGFGPCPEGTVEGDADAAASVAHLPLPAEAVVLVASADQGLQNVQGTSPRTPVEIMVDYLRLDGWTVLNAEDEVFESELLVEKDGLRVFVKAQATCERGSAFVVFASDDPALVPTPVGAGG